MAMQERRIRQRRVCRTDIMFPLRDRSDCIVPFDRSRIPDRRQQNPVQGETDARSSLDVLSSGYRNSEDATGSATLPFAHDSVRNFSISGELIAIVNNLYSSRSPGRWKELELYRTQNRQYVCLEVWRTTWEGERDQYWLVTCDDLKAVRKFFGNSRLACDLFYEASQEIREQGD
jgi:hypothetical protein